MNEGWLNWRGVRWLVYWGWLDYDWFGFNHDWLWFNHGLWFNHDWLWLWLWLWHMHCYWSNVLEFRNWNSIMHWNSVWKKSRFFTLDRPFNSYPACKVIREIKKYRLSLNIEFSLKIYESLRISRISIFDKDVVNNTCWFPWIWDQVVSLWAPCAEWFW